MLSYTRILTPYTPLLNTGLLDLQDELDVQKKASWDPKVLMERERQRDYKVRIEFTCVLGFTGKMRGDACVCAVYTYTYIYVIVYICMYMCVCVCVYMYIVGVCTYMYIHIHMFMCTHTYRYI